MLLSSCPSVSGQRSDDKISCSPPSGIFSSQRYHHQFGLGFVVFVDLFYVERVLGIRGNKRENNLMTRWLRRTFISCVRHSTCGDGFARHFPTADRVLSVYEAQFVCIYSLRIAMLWMRPTTRKAMVMAYIADRYSDTLIQRR